jgi:hypothetical protein
VVAGHAQVVLIEGAGGEEQGTARGVRGEVVDRVGAAVSQQAGAAAGRCCLDHGGGRADPRVGAAQVLLDLRQVRAHRRRLAGAERLGQVLVDVGVDGDDRQPLCGQVPYEQRRQGRLAAAALARERDLRSSSTPLSLSVPVRTRGIHHIEMVFIFSKNERDSNRTVTERTSRCR